MHRTKQLLPLGGKALLEHALANVRAAQVHEIILVLGFAAGEIQQKISTSGLTVITNENYHEGMGASLRMGLGAVSPRSSGALIVLADQPFVCPSTLDGLIEFHRKHRPEILIPLYKGFRGNPVLLDRCVFPEVVKLKGDIGCRAIFGGHTQGIHKLPVDDSGILLDVDTIDDFNMLAALFEAGEAGSGLLSNPDLEIARFESDQTASQPELVVVGRDLVALALLRLSRMLGFTATVVDPFLTLGYLTDAHRVLHCLDFSMLPQNPDRHIVVASRGQFDEEALEQAFSTKAPYIGLIANSARREELLRILKTRGIPQEMLDRLHAPAGLDIGAETPEEIALSIMAEIVSERRRNQPQ
jgi:molybdenum cofactor cytidylyltransferase